MLNGRNLILDTMSEVYHPLRPWADGEFWDLAEHQPRKNSIYVIGRKQFTENTKKVRELCESPDHRVVFDNAAEGSWTMISQLQALGMDDLARDGRLLLISGGDLESGYSYILFDHFMICILDYEENLKAMSQWTKIFDKIEKPYNFLFLNGRARPHRKYLFERLRRLGLLDQALWTMLDTRPSINRHFRIEEDGVNVMATSSPLQHLPACYEFEFFRDVEIPPGPPNRTFVKHELFNNLWGEIYLEPAPYIDTYFSLVTETVFEYPYSFRTEKIAKPLAMSHPWICATSPGFYRDLRDLGFRTFDHLIDESFDLIDNNQDRMDRIVAVVQDLCQNDLPSFLEASRDVCKYNQQHLQQLMPRLQQEFPDRFSTFLHQHG